MSFVVSINGSFKPYELPEYYKTRFHEPQSSVPRDVVKEDEAFDSASERKNRNQQSINSYEKVKHTLPKKRTSVFARDFMSKDVRTVPFNANIIDVKNSFDKFNYHHLPVVNNENVLIGMLSEIDLLKNPQAHLVEEVMSKEVLTCKESATIQDIARIMLIEKLSALPVLNDKFIMTGIVTKTDILECVMKNMPLEVLI